MTPDSHALSSRLTGGGGGGEGVGGGRGGWEGEPWRGGGRESEGK